MLYKSENKSKLAKRNLSDNQLRIVIYSDIQTIKLLFKHRLYHSTRNDSKNDNLIYSIFLLIVLILFYEILNSALPSELKGLFPLILLATDFSLKFFLKPDIYYNLLPYLSLPIKKKFLVNSILRLEAISGWNLYCCASIFVLFHTNFFSAINLDSFLSSINIYLLFVFNNYCVIYIKYALNKLFAFLLFPIFLCLIFPAYLLFDSGILCTMVIFALIIIIFYGGRYTIINEIYKQLDDFSL